MAITYETVLLRNVRIKTEKESKHKNIMTLTANNKKYYIYIVYKDIEYPVHLPEYQREFKGTGADLDMFISDVRRGIKMQPAMKINFRAIDNVIYASIIDGQQRLTNICHIKGNIKKSKEYNKYKTWSVEQQVQFENFEIPCEYFWNKTYDQEKEEFNISNTRSKPLTMSEKRNTLLSNDEMARFKELSGLCSTIYPRDSKKGKELDHVYRMIMIDLYVNHSEDSKKYAMYSMGDACIRNMIKYISELSDKDFKNIKKEIRNICNLIDEIMSATLAGKNNCLRNETGKAKLVNTDILVLSIMTYLKNNPDEEDSLEENGEYLQMAIVDTYGTYVGSGSSNLKTITAAAKPVIEAIETTMLSLK